MADVVCVGILCADVLVKPVTILPDKGKLLLVDQMQLSVGGCAANAAIDLAHLGLSSSVIGKIGDDDFGVYLSNRLVKEGVETRCLVVDPVESTSSSVVTIAADGERSILHCLGANAVFRFEDIQLSEIRKSRLLFIAGTFLMNEFDGPGAIKLLSEAHNAGLLCCCDTAWDSTGRWMQTIKDMLPMLDWFMPSYEEAVQLSGFRDPFDIAKSFRQHGVKNVVVKLGESGCYVLTENEESFTVPAYTDIRVVDTSGAGDAFCAGFITGIILGFDVCKTAQFANAVGANCVMQVGTTQGVRSIQDTINFIERQNGI